MSHTDPNLTSQRALLRARDLRWLGWSARLDGQFTHEWAVSEGAQAEGRSREFAAGEAENRPWWDAEQAARILRDQADDAVYEATSSPVGWALHSRPLPGRDPSRIRHGVTEPPLPRWVIVTPGHVYGPRWTWTDAHGTPAASTPGAIVRLATADDEARLAAQEAAWDEIEATR